MPKINTTKIIIFIQIALIFLAVLFSEGHFHFDEHFQILEFLNYKLGNNNPEQLPWEFKEGMRPWFQIFIYFMTTKFLTFFTLFNPFSLAKFFRFETAILSVTAIILIYKWINLKKSSQTDHSIFAFIFCLWFWPFLSARISNECFFGFIFVIGLLIYNLNELKKNKWLEFLAYCLFTQASWGRFQISFAFLGFILWAILGKRFSKNNLQIFFSAVLATALLNLVIDFWGYGTWTFTPWNYFYHNAIQNRAANFGISPWYSYFVWIVTKSQNPFMGILTVIGLFWLWIKKPKSQIALITFVFLLAHVVIGHKELRFLFPLALSLPFLLLEIFENPKWQKVPRLLVHFLLYSNMIICIFMTLNSSNPLISIYKVMDANLPIPDTFYYFGGENPLRPGNLKMTWYFETKTEAKSIESKSQISCSTPCWVFADRYSRISEMEEGNSCIQLQKSSMEKLYASLPEKIIRKSRFFTLWKCQTI